MKVSRNSLHMKAKDIHPLYLFKEHCNLEQRVICCPVWITLRVNTWWAQTSSNSHWRCCSVKMLKPGTSRTFFEYGEQVFLPYFTNWIQRVQRLDIVWDVYLPSSLKSSTRRRRGKNIRWPVLPVQFHPAGKNYCIENNKEELFEFLAHETVKHMPRYKEVVASLGRDVLTHSPRYDLSNLHTWEGRHQYDCPFG